MQENRIFGAVGAGAAGMVVIGKRWRSVGLTGKRKPELRRLSFNGTYFLVIPAPFLISSSWLSLFVNTLSCTFVPLFSFR